MAVNLHLPASVLPELHVWAKAQPDIARLYVFGSRIRGVNKDGGPVRSDSDLDIAIELMPEIESTTLAWGDKAGAWREQVATRVPFPVHLQLLDAETPSNRRYVDETGILIFDRQQPSPPDQSEVTSQRSAPMICYLCGKALSEPISRDHVPPDQIFPKELRKAHNLDKLLTIKVHKACNEAFARDEEYFAQALAPLGRGSVAGNAFLQKVVRDYHDGKKRGLVTKVLEEFEERPSGLILPGDLVAKRFDGERMHRVAWKIVRGLVFDRTAIVMPEDWTVGVTITAPGQKPPEHFQKFMALGGGTEGGEYPGIFAYRYADFTLGQYWALLLWDRIIVTVLFHRAGCRCSECAPVGAVPDA